MANHTVTTVDEMTITTCHNVMAILGSFAKDIFEYNRWLSDPFCRVNCEACHLGGRKFWSQVGCNVSPPHSRPDQELSSPWLSPPEALLPPGWLTLLQHWALSRKPVLQRWGCRDDDGGACQWELNDHDGDDGDDRMFITFFGLSTRAQRVLSCLLTLVVQEPLEWMNH